MNHNRVRRSVDFLITLLSGAVFISFSIAAEDVSGFKPEKLREIEAAISESINARNLPGAVICIGHREHLYLKSFGNRSLAPEKSPMTVDTIFDAASLTKVIATAPSIMLLVERGKIASLDDPVKNYIKEFDREGREKITIRHLLTHTSGLRAGISPNPPWNGYDTGIKLACAEKPRTAPGTNFLYSDINFILLGEIVHRVSGMPLNEFAEKEIFIPLKMFDTGFLPQKEKISRIAPTQFIGKEMLRGVVHDPVARNMGGVAGHAGVFTTASDLARFCRMFLNNGELDGVRILKPETVRLMRTVQTTNLEAKRGLGWDIDSGYSKPRGKLFPIGSYGHTGFTGTALWIDPYSQVFWIFLSNRVHPDGKGNVLALEYFLGTLVAEAINGVNYSEINTENKSK
ncbi:MAG: serine hydrolase domain-containing protein [Verrucomicrobiia bacterium]